MFKLKNIINQKKNEGQIIKILFYTFPLSFIIGNLAISINTRLFIITSLFFIKKKQLSIRFDKSVWILIIFFLYFFLSTSVQFLYPGFLNTKLANYPLETNPLLKSFLLFRFVLLILVIDTLLYNNKINLKNFCFSSLICTSFVSFDVILQYFIGVDLFGYKNFVNWNSGPFGDELIAGSYLKNFSLFSLVYVFLNFKKIIFKNSLLIFILSLHLTAILLSGNRMPLVLFLFGCFLLFFLIKNMKFSISLGTIFFCIIFFGLAKNDKVLKQNYAVFLGDINFSKLFNEKVIENDDSLTTVPKNVVLLRHSGYSRVFKTAIVMWKKQPLVGFGLKSFRVKCWEILDEDSRKSDQPQDISCGNHPHNYYLELLSESGIIGVVLIISFFILMLRYSFFIIKGIYRIGSNELILLTPPIISVILEIWPLRSSGSFFTNTNATFLWLVVGMLLSSSVKNSLYKNLAEKNT